MILPPEAKTGQRVLGQPRLPSEIGRLSQSKISKRKAPSQTPEQSTSSFSLVPEQGHSAFHARVYLYTTCPGDGSVGKGLCYQPCRPELNPGTHVVKGEKTPTGSAHIHYKFQIKDKCNFFKNKRYRETILPSE